MEKLHFHFKYFVGVFIRFIKPRQQQNLWYRPIWIQYIFLCDPGRPDFSTPARFTFFRNRLIFSWRAGAGAKKQTCRSSLSHSGEPETTRQPEPLRKMKFKWTFDGSLRERLRPGGHRFDPRDCQRLNIRVKNEKMMFVTQVGFHFFSGSLKAVCYYF